MCKILNNYGMKKFEDLYEKEFKQGANVFSYYIIKFFLLYKLNESCNYKNLQPLWKIENRSKFNKYEEVITNIIT